MCPPIPYCTIDIEVTGTYVRTIIELMNKTMLSIHYILTIKKFNILYIFFFLNHTFCIISKKDQRLDITGYNIIIYYLIQI